MPAEAHGIIQSARDFAAGMPEGTSIFVIVFSWVSGFLYLRTKRSKTNLGVEVDNAQVAQIKSLQDERDTAVKDARETWQKLLLNSERMGVLQAESTAFKTRAEKAEGDFEKSTESLGRARRDRAVAEGRLKDALTLAKQVLPPEGYDLIVLEIYKITDVSIAKELSYDDSRPTDKPPRRGAIKRLTDSFLGTNLGVDGGHSAEEDG